MTNKNGSMRSFLMLAVATLLSLVLLRGPADAANPNQTVFARFPAQTEQASASAVTDLAEVPFTVPAGGGDYLFEVTATMFLTNFDSTPGHPFMGYEVRLEVDGAELPDIGVSEIGLDLGTTEVTTQVVQTSFRSMAPALRSGNHTLTVTWISFDAGCTVQAGASESTVVVRRM